MRQLQGDTVLIIQKFIVMLQKDGCQHGIKKKNILHVLYANSKFSIDLPYNSTDLLPANKYNQILLIKQSVRIKPSS